MVQPGSKQLNERRQKIKQLVVAAIEVEGSNRVKDIAIHLHNSDKTITMDEIILAIRELEKTDSIVLFDYGHARSSPISNQLLNILQNMSLKLLITVMALTLATVYLLPEGIPWNIIRILAGSVFVLFLPGYFLLQFLFPSKVIDRTERLVISVSISLAIVPLIGFLLNFTVWGVTLNSVIISMSIFTIALALASIYKKDFGMEKIGIDSNDGINNISTEK